MVQSSEVIPAMYRSTFFPNDFQNIVVHRGDLAKTCDALRAAEVECVIPGCELGVILADQLSERLGLTTNGTQQSAARRNKAMMMETLRRHKVRTPQSAAFGEVSQAIEFAMSVGRWPMVLKPLSSSGSNGVFLCRDRSEIEHAFVSIIGHADVFGTTNASVLVQEFLRGPEFAIDTVSHQGRHHVAAYWQYGKQLPPSVFSGIDTMELLPYRESLHQQLFPYVSQVLDTLGIRHGAAHCEIILTAEGPVLVEVGARLNGGNNPMLSRDCGGRSQIDLTLDAYLNEAEFARQSETCYRIDRGAMRVFLIPRERGILNSPPRFELIETLPSFLRYRFSAKPGHRLSRIAGWVVLSHSNRDVMHQDLRQIRRLEDNGFYSVTPDPQK